MCELYIFLWCASEEGGKLIQSTNSHINKRLWCVIRRRKTQNIGRWDNQQSHIPYSPAFTDMALCTKPPIFKNGLLTWVGIELAHFWNEYLNDKSQGVRSPLTSIQMNIQKSAPGHFNLSFSGRLLSAVRFPSPIPTFLVIVRPQQLRRFAKVGESSPRAAFYLQIITLYSKHRRHPGFYFPYS